MEYFNLMSVQTDGGSTFASEGNIEELRLNKGGEPDLAYRFGSYSYTLTQLLQQANAPMRIDFLSLDVEGAELSVIKGIDFNRYSFEYILIETSQAQAVSQLLEVHNYILFESLTKVDLLFRRREANVLSA